MRFMTRRSVILTVLALALIAMLAALTACGDDSSSSSGVKTYTDQKYGYSFEYPGSWKLEEGGDRGRLRRRLLRGERGSLRSRGGGS